MKAEPTHLSIERIASAFKLSDWAAGRLLSNDKWVNLILPIIICDRFELDSADNGLYALREHNPQQSVRIVLLRSNKFNFVPPKTRFDAERFIIFWQEAVAGAVVATYDKMWFIKSAAIIEWHEIGTLKDGTIQREKAMRLFAALPET